MNAQPKRKYVQVVKLQNGEIVHSLLAEDDEDAKWCQVLWSTQYDPRQYDVVIVEAG